MQQVAGALPTGYKQTSNGSEVGFQPVADIPGKARFCIRTVYSIGFWDGWCIFMHCLPCFFLPLGGFEKGVCKPDEAFGSGMSEKGSFGCQFVLGWKRLAVFLYAEPLAQQPVAVEAHTQPGAGFRGGRMRKGKGRYCAIVCRKCVAILEGKCIPLHNGSEFICLH